MTKLRIALTGGGTGGHIYPLAAVADVLATFGKGDIELRYFGPHAPWNEALAARNIAILNIAGSKLRRYASFQNFIDIPKFFLGLLQALFKLYFFMPDAVFSKGGPGALPVVLAAAWYRIPVVIHESDGVPGLTNQISAYLAKRIGISFHHAGNFFDPRKTFFSGSPVRRAIADAKLETRAAKSQLGFDQNASLLLVLGGSQGAKVLNDFVQDAVGLLAVLAEVYHQTGPTGSPQAGKGNVPRYRAEEFLDDEKMTLALSAADLVLTRAGAGAIYECAARGVPAILVPLERGANRHQHANAEEYAASGAAIVLEENNLTPNLAVGEIKKLLADEERRKTMGERARAFYRSDAAEVIAREVIAVAGAKIVGEN